MRNISIDKNPIYYKLLILLIYFYVRSKIIYCNVKEYIAFAHKSYLNAFNLKKVNNEKRK